MVTVCGQSAPRRDRATMDPCPQPRRRSRRSATPRCWSSSTRPRSSSSPPHAEAHGFTGVMAADHFQPWIPQQGQASFVWNVLSALGQTHHRRPRHRRHRAHVPHASRDGRPGIRDPRRHVPGTALARPRQRRGAQRARRRRLLARCPRAHQPHVRGRRHHQEAVRERAQRQGRPPRGSVLPPRIDAAVDDAGTRPRHPGRRIRARHRQARRPHRRRPHHRGRPAREARDPAHPLRRGRARGRPRQRARCPRCSACT